MNLKQILLMTAAVLACTGLSQPSAVADIHPQPEAAKPRTAKLERLRFDRRSKRFTLRASIASRALNAKNRRRQSLSAQVKYKAARKSVSQTIRMKLTNVRVVSRHTKAGLAMVEITWSGSAPDQLKSVQTSVELVGANPTPYP